MNRHLYDIGEVVFYESIDGDVAHGVINAVFLDSDSAVKYRVDDMVYSENYLFDDGEQCARCIVKKYAKELTLKKAFAGHSLFLDGEKIC